MWNRLKKKRYLIPLQIVVALVLVLSLLLTGSPLSKDITSDTQTIGMGEKAFTIGMADVAYAAGTPDYACDGVDDNVQFQLAFNALPATGGKIVVLGGNYSFSAAVTRAIDNITVEGMGRSSFLSRDGVNPLFTIGVQSNWTFINLRFDAGGVNDTGSTEVTYENVDIGGTLWAYDTSIDIGGASWDIPVGRGATIIIAASNATASSIAQADYVCDGVDDEVQVQAALDSLNNNTSGKIVFTNGLFVFSDSVTTITRHQVTIEGQGKGTQITWANGINVVGKFLFDIGQSGTPMMRWTFRDIFLTGNHAGVAAGGGGIRIFAAQLAVDNLKIDGYNEDGLYIGQGSAGVNIRHNNIATASVVAGTNAIVLDRTGDSKIINNNLSGDNDEEVGVYVLGVGASPSQSIWISENYFNMGKSAIIASQTANLKIRDNIFNRSNENAIYIPNTALNSNMIGISITDNYFNIWGDDNPATNFAINIVPESTTFTSDDLKILNNHFYGGAVPQRVLNFNYIDRYTGGLVAGNTFNGYTVEVMSLRPTGIKFWEKYVDIFMDVLAVSATDIRNNEDLSAGVPITFTIDAQPDVPRTLSGHFDAHANITAYTIVFTGVDAKGYTLTETMTEVDGWDWETSNAFATVTSIVMTARTGTGVGDTMDIGITDVLGLSNAIYETGDVYKIKKNNANATIAGAQVDITYSTYDFAVIGLGATDDFTIWLRSNLNILN